MLLELQRLQRLQGLETLLRFGGATRIAGVDEAGRGCLAGPVTAAAVVVDPRVVVPGVDDSKALSPEHREALADAVRRAAVAWAVVHVDAQIIDRINILQATRRAMAQALAGLRVAPDLALVDAVLPAEPRPVPCLPVIRGDAISYAVASASILAKVTRDRFMEEQDRRYPQYGFASHKGYGAPQHRQALEAYGPCPLHRLTFRSVLPRTEDGAVAPLSSAASSTAASSSAASSSTHEGTV